MRAEYGLVQFTRLISSARDPFLARFAHALNVALKIIMGHFVKQHQDITPLPDPETLLVEGCSVPEVSLISHAALFKVFLLDCLVFSICTSYALPSFIVASHFPQESLINLNFWSGNQTIVYT